jgi:pyruvate dehydrogenase E2 component (dihydrolipoamide acetyltransferase)
MSNREVAATPLVRRLAAQLGVSLAAVQATGVGGRIRKADVLAAAGVLDEFGSLFPPTSAQSPTNVGIPEAHIDAEFAKLFPPDDRN